VGEQMHCRMASFVIGGTFAAATAILEAIFYAAKTESADEF
jgi:hypothetical protein